MGQLEGFATITPASGFVGPVGALVVGVAGGFVCYFASQLIIKVLKVDYSLEVFPVHGVGGMLGTLLVAVFASTTLGGVGLEVNMGHQIWVQVVGITVTAIWTSIITYLILLVVKALRMRA